MNTENKEKKEFKINDYITLKLENNETNVYVLNKRFLQCINLVWNISISDVESYNDIESVDDIAERVGGQEGEMNAYISSEAEFWGHCSV